MGVTASLDGPRLWIARRPALPAAVLFIAGIGLYQSLPPAPSMLLPLMAVALLAAAWQIHRPRCCCIFLALALLLGGAISAQLFAFFYPHGHIGEYATEMPRLAQLEMRIIQTPRVLTNPFDHRHAMPPRQVTTGRILRVCTWSGWVDSDGQVLVQIAQPHARLAAGQTVRITGMLQRPSPAMNPGQFDWACYYRQQRVLASVSISHADNIRILTEDFPGALTVSREKVRRLLAMGFPAGRALDHALLRALLLGDHDPQLRDVREQFQRSGTSHQLAVSGMHVAVLGGFVYLLCRICCMRPRWAVLIGMLFVWCYGLVAMPSPPVIRAVLLWTAFGTGALLRRWPDAVQLLSLSALAMLVWQPLDLYTTGFQLSFGTMLGLLLLARPTLAALRGQPDPDELASRDLVKVSRWRVIWRWVDRAALDSFAFGLVAWWVSMPLIAYHFEQLNPWAIGAGIILFPVVLLALIGGMLKVMLTLCWPALAGIWAMLAAEPVALMRHMVDALAHLPASDVPVPPPTAGVIVAFYLLLLPILLPKLRPGARWTLRASRVLMAGVMLVLPLQQGIEHLATRGETRITLLAVGAGQCAVVQPPSGRMVLIDAGSSSLADLRSNCLGPFLRHTHCMQVDTIFLSHGDYDHISAVEDVVAGYGVREVLTSGPFLAQAPREPFTRRLLASLDQVERPPQVLSPGQRIPLGRDTFVEVLWPPKQGLPPTGSFAHDSNDGCLVIRLTHAGRSVLFPGDIQDGAMRELLKNPARLKSDILIAPHHGSAESLTRAFVQAVNPSSILSSNDRRLSNKQREFESLIDSRPLYRTSRCGGITVILGRSGKIRIEPFLPSPQ